MAKIPAGVGPRHPQVVVLFGATGDLSRRKLIPGLLHLASAGFIPACRIIGVSLDPMDPDAFREFAREALNESARKVADTDWSSFAGCLDYVPQAAGPGALTDAVNRAEKSIGARMQPTALSIRAAERGTLGGAHARRGRAGHQLAHHHGKAFWHRPQERGGAQCQAARGVRRAADIPHRSFSRQGAGAEHPGVSLRQWSVRTDLESQLHQPSISPMRRRLRCPSTASVRGPACASTSTVCNSP